MSKTSLLTPLFPLLLCMALCRIATAETGQLQNYRMDINGLERNYLVYEPAASKDERLPLMIVMHGGLGNAEKIEKNSMMNEVADEGKFIVAYPNGTGGRFGKRKNMRTWNAGNCCGRAAKTGIDDVFFIEKIIEEIDSNYYIDTARVYVAGMSNGAMMAYRLACEIPEKIAAIIPVAGVLAVDNCERAINIPVLHIHGDQDQFVPFDGGTGASSLSGVAHRSVPETVECMIQDRGCDTPETNYLVDGCRLLSYKSSHGAIFQLLVIEGGGHVWPGGRRDIKQSSNRGRLSASKLAWQFAKKFTKKP